MDRETIAVRADVYERLQARKRDDESVSDVLERLLADRRDVAAGFGAWAATDAAAAARRTREELVETIERRAERAGSDDAE